MSHLPKKCDGLSDSFLSYWESLGFFNISSKVLPKEFMIIFDIARIIDTYQSDSDIKRAIEELTDERFGGDAEEEIFYNKRLIRSAPLGDRMELDRYRNIYDLKKALPRELANDDDIIDVKLFTRTLMVQRFYETDKDNFRFINTTRTGERDSNRFEQKFYLLLDRSRSMEKKLRSFYSKCIVVELLRRKLGSGARLYFRPFDSKTGNFFRISDRNDFHALIREVLLTTTGGTGTNIQRAVFQAVDDINFDSEMMHTEILVVTDGLAAIDREELKDKLGQIRLNILKIGADHGDPNWFEIEKMLLKHNIKIDPFHQDMEEIRDGGPGSFDARGHQPDSRDLVLKRMANSFVKKQEKDLKEVAYRYIEIGDIDMSAMNRIDQDHIDAIERAITEIEELVSITSEAEELAIIYKKIYFLADYITLLLESSGQDSADLKRHLERLGKMKTSLLENREVLLIVSDAHDMEEDRNMMKSALKEARTEFRSIASRNELLSHMDKRIARIMKGRGPGNMNIFHLVYRMILRLIDHLKNSGAPLHASLSRRH